MKKKTTAFMIAAATVMLFLMGKASALVLLVALMYLLFQIADEEMDAACPKWDVVAYEVERMDLEQLFSALGDEEYCSYAFARV